jgi:hypothetical protein
MVRHESLRLFFAFSSVVSAYCTISNRGFHPARYLPLTFRYDTCALEFLLAAIREEAGLKEKAETGKVPGDSNRQAAELKIGSAMPDQFRCRATKVRYA